MTTKVIVNGAAGKMGVLACQTIQDHPDFELVAALGRHDNLGQVIDQTKARIVIDLTRADCAFANASTIIAHKAHPIIGTTGLSDSEIQDLQQQCETQQLGGVIAPNFSINVALMIHCAALCSRFQSEVEIVEAHHQKKLDAPSGTAIKTADVIAKARIQPKNHLEIKTSLPGARGATYQEINIHSLRLPGIVAKQDIIFGNTGETLTISHECIDRSAYMPGLILACQHVQNLKTMYYGLEKLIQF